MSFSVNDPFLYLLSAIIVVFVVAQSAFFLVKANRRAQQMGIAAATVRKTILSVSYTHLTLPTNSLV